MPSSVQSNNVASSEFRRACKLCCRKTFDWIPVLLIASITVWSYYAYVFEMCIKILDNMAQKCVYLVLCHILLIMFAWSYWRAIFKEILPIPERYKLPAAEREKLDRAESEAAQRKILENFVNDLPIVTRTSSGSVRYCNRCALVKPDRAHHCRHCARCVLKMDHHCVWVNNCVAYHNYKFFVLFLGYSFAYCLLAIFTSLPYFIMFCKGEFKVDGKIGRYFVLCLLFVAGVMAVVTGSLFITHVIFLIKNRTTLESFRAPTFRGGTNDKSGFSIGCCNNFKEVFGNRPGLWLLPVFTSLGDGCNFPVRREYQLRSLTPTREKEAGTTRSRSDVNDTSSSANA